MWALDDEAALRATFISVALLDRPADLTRLRRRLRRASAGLALLRRRVAEAPFDLAPPRWEDDPDFDIGRHVRCEALPGGTQRELLDLAADRCAEPFDRDHPLWELTVVDGLAGGGGALLAKIHHVLADGTGAVRISASFLDTAPGGGPEPPAALRPPWTSSTAASTGWIGSAARTVGPIITANVDEARRTVAAVAGGVSTMVRSPGTGASLAWSTARSVARQVGVIDPARSPLWRERTHDHRFEVTSLELARVAATGKALGGTVNDAFVTIMAAAAGAYHRALGADADELRISVPVSTRRDGEAGGNAWAPTRVLVPVGEMTPRERFAEVHRRLAHLKSEPSLGLVDGLASSIRRLPRPLLVRLARQQAGTVDFACSNVRGAPFDLWIAGAHVDASYPFGPTVGVACNASVLSYRGALDLGLNCDAGAIGDPALLRRCIDDAAGELLV